MQMMLSQQQQQQRQMQDFQAMMSTQTKQQNDLMVALVSKLIEKNSNMSVVTVMSTKTGKNWA